MMRKVRYAFLPLALLILFGLNLQKVVFGAPITTSSRPDFYASFNGTLNAVDQNGNEILPLAERGVQFVNGLHGKAAYIGGNGEKSYDNAPTLQYSARQLLSGPSGTIMFWVKPDWDGEVPQGQEKPFYRFFDAGPKFNLFMYHWLRWDVGIAPQSGTSSTVQPGEVTQLINHNRAAWFKGDWWHIAMSWDSNGWTKLYVNGLPYMNGFEAPGKTALKQPLELGQIDSFFVGSTGKSTYLQNMRANSAFAELKIYKRSLPDTQIMSEYRRLMPLDMTVERQFLRANQPEKFDVDVWSGGQMTRPAIGEPVKTPVVSLIEATFSRESDGVVVAHQNYALNLLAQKTISLAVPKLSEGIYRATYRVRGSEGVYQTSRRAYLYQQQATPRASYAPLKLGIPVINIDCATQETGGLEKGPTRIISASNVGSYRESSGERDSRFSYILDFSALAKNGKLDGQPMMLDIYWPDDKPRSMGLYLYRESKDKEQRDRLQGGIQSGDEYPLSGRVQKTSYLIYPWTAKYLFEARTMIKGFPAAVKQIVVSPVEGRLPKLPIQLPVGLASRNFGHLDEDQTWDVMFAYDAPLPWYQREIKNMEMLLDYLDYTGQNIFSYAFVRYEDVHYNLPGTIAGRGSYFVSFDGWRSLMLDMLAARGKKLRASVNISTIMEAHKLPEQREALLAQNYYLIDRSGKPVNDFLKGNWRPNPLHLLYKQQFMGHLNEILRRFGQHPAFAGIDLWGSRDWQILDLNAGYDDLTISMFERETGITVPAEKGANRFAARYDYLTGAKRKEWVAWRAAKNAAFLTEITKTMRVCNPKLTLGLALSGAALRGSLTDASAESLDFSKFYLEEQGLDLAKLKQISGLAIAPIRWPTLFRWQQHREGNYTTSEDLIYDMRRQSIFRNKGASYAYSYPSYFESFNDSLKTDTFSSLFQNADVKPYGRYFLKELAADVAAIDPATILIGAQPLGTSGRDTESREFAQAFRALPDGDYKDVAGMRDPVCVRSTATIKGNYLYVQNLLGAEVSINLAAAEKTKIIDLSSSLSVPRSGSTWHLNLKPFQLRSFRISSGNIGLKVLNIQVSDNVSAFYSAKLASIEKDVAALREQGGEAELYNQLLVSLHLAVEQRRFAEAHRLAFSKPVRQLPDLVRVAAQGFLKQQKAMLAVGHIAIKCGSSSYYRTEQGQLFFPDQAFTQGGYGYIGSHKIASHDTSNISDAVERQLFSTEAYDAQGYRFSLPKGTYTVRIFNRIGYLPDAEQGKVVMNLNIQGKPIWENMDLFLALNKDFGRTLTSEFKGISVSDGTLNIEWPSVNNRYGWCNAIEVVPESIKKQ